MQMSFQVVYTIYKEKKIVHYLNSLPSLDSSLPFKCFLNSNPALAPEFVHKFIKTFKNRIRCSTVTLK